VSLKDNEIDYFPLTGRQGTTEHPAARKQPHGQSDIELKRRIAKKKAARVGVQETLPP